MIEIVDELIPKSVIEGLQSVNAFGAFLVGIKDKFNADEEAKVTKALEIILSKIMK